MIHFLFTFRFSSFETPDSRGPAAAQAEMPSDMEPLRPVLGLMRALGSTVDLGGGQDEAWRGRPFGFWRAARPAVHGGTGRTLPAFA